MIRHALVALISGAASLASQVQVTASGNLQISYEGSVGGVVTQVLPVTGSASLALSQVASVELILGDHSSLTATAVSPPWNCWGCWSLAAGEVVLQFSSATPIAGELQLRLEPACQMSPMFIDVEDDGLLELHSHAVTTTSVPVVLGPTPLAVRIDIETVNFGGANCSVPASVTFVPFATALRTMNHACGPVTSATMTPAPAGRSMQLHVANTTGLIGIIGIGDIAIPGACAPATSPLASVIVIPTPSGIDYHVPVSAALIGSYTLQYAELTPSNQIAFSNAIVARLN